MGVVSLNPVPMSFYRDTTAVVSTLWTMYEVEDLVPSSHYAISVRAFTSVGAGQFSKMVIGGTEEDGEFFNISLCVSCMCLQCSTCM